MTLRLNRYNGLNWRVSTAWTATPGVGEAAATAPNRLRVQYYGADWRLMQEDHYDHPVVGEPVGAPDRVSLQVWGLRGLDDAVARSSGAAVAEPGERDTLFYLTDALGSPVALLDEFGRVRERVEYDPYGLPTAYAGTDFNRDGILDLDDLSDFIGAFYQYQSAGNAEAQQEGTGDLSDFRSDYSTFPSIPGGAHPNVLTSGTDPLGFGAACPAAGAAAQPYAVDAYCLGGFRMGCRLDGRGVPSL